jgi:para-nitrobenzyl esterase
VVGHDRRVLPGRGTAALAGLVLLLLAACTGPVAVVGTAVRVEQGVLRGLADGDVLRFGDVPYAAAPTGPLRWAPPAPAPEWSGARDATVRGSRCPQRAAAPGVPHATAASTDEDCLVLDVTVPAGTPEDAGLPVLVWLHGGGFSAGAGSDYDPRRLALAGPMVVVTVNYRLGALGFLALPGLPGAGSFGLLDQQAALGWVQRNAAAFGGDPRRVTLAGESAGADGVCAQLASPAAAGLFAAAVMQSAGCGTANIVDAIVPGTGPAGDTWKPLPVAEQVGLAAAARVGCTRPEEALACLRGRSVERLTDIAGVYWSPAVGTPVLPARPSDVLGTVPPVPVLAGTTRDEGTLFVAAFLPGGVDDRGLRGLLGAAAGDRAREVGAAYRPQGRSPARVWADVVTDRAYACPALRTYAALAARGPLYAYEYADPAAPSPFAALPGDLADGVAHGAEVPSLLDLRPGPPAPSGADALVGAWARFVTTGAPGGGWPAWSGEGQVVTLDGGAPAPRPAARLAAEHRCDLW